MQLGVKLGVKYKIRLLSLINYHTLKLKSLLPLSPRFIIMSTHDSLEGLNLKGLSFFYCLMFSNKSY